MKFYILKKANEPISFRGFKGMYLNYALITILITLFSVIFSFIITSNRTVLFSVITLLVLFSSFILKNLKSKSKGDYNIFYKRGANKSVQIKGKPINYKNLL
ncbi:DUF4133 domain-containing protein [Tenacibaculum ovolyticum]|uniref:DUF4133 domain-containing protein n=1 Tax=Tenacibaculum ovolyticum TaxID=104270 RepID=UPI0007ED728B